MRLLAILALVFASLVAVVPAMAQEAARFALLIGNKSYSREVGPLVNPHNDVDLLNGKLAQVGFTVLPIIKDGKRSTILGGVRDLVRRLNTAGPGAVGFLYYSGHGAAELETGINYLIPVDATDPTASTFWDEALKLDDVLRLLAGAREAAKVIVFDACRNELTLPVKTTNKGFLPVADQQGSFIAYASEFGRTASDKGRTSGPYAAALAAEIVKPGLDHLGLFQNVKEAVIASTGGAQRPWESNGLSRRVYLTGPAAAGVAAPPTKMSAAIEAWVLVRLTRSTADLEVYIERFGDTYYGDLAKRRLQELRTAALVEQKYNPPSQDGLDTNAIYPHGMVLTPLDSALRRKFNIDKQVAHGLVVVGVATNSPAGNAGITVGDVIVEVAQKPVVKVEDVTLAIARVRSLGRKIILFRVENPKGELRFVALTAD